MKFLADEDFNNDILRGLFRILPEFDVVRVQDVGLIEKHDREILEWASKENKLILTHDFSTMINFAYERVANGEHLEGLILVPQTIPIGEAINELALLIECSLENEWENRIAFIPLQN
jgi:Domain of unknown function (DUF5615)